MWYRDLDGTEEANVAMLAEFFDCSEASALEIWRECQTRHDRGDKGESFSERIDQIKPRDDYHLLRAIQASLNESWAVNRFGGVDTSDLAQLFHDAWKDGIQRKDRVTVVLDNSTCDAVCGECGRCLPNGSDECEECGCTDIDQQVMVTVSDSYAELWADDDKYIDGSTWESVGNGEIYTILSTRPGLAAELEAEGYKLDLSNYDEPEAETT